MNKDNYAKALARISKILARLQLQGGFLCAKELADEFGVSLRTLRRDVKNMGAPFTYSSDRIFIQNEDTNNTDISLAITYIKTLAQSSGEEMRAAIYALLAQIRNPTYIEPEFFTRNNFQEITLDLESMWILQECIKEGRCVEFVYAIKRVTQNIKKRIVQPLKILAFEGEWYLLGEEKIQPKEQNVDLEAIATSRGIVKKFYLNDIGKVSKTLLGRKVDEWEITQGLHAALNAWFHPNGKRIEVVLWVDSQVAKYFKRRKLSPLQHIDEQSDGSLEISLPITHFMEISGEIMRWIPHIIVLEPLALREFIEAKIRAYIMRLEQ